MKFKLPKLHLLVTSDKKVSDDNARKYIHVVGGHAIVNNEIIVAVNLRNYVKIECSITDEFELNRLSGILDWMEGKSFTKDFWQELVKENFVNLNGNNNIEIENVNYNKILVYEEVVSDNVIPFEVIRDNIDRPGSPVQRIAYDGKVLSLLTKTFGSELTNDSIIFEYTGQENASKFTLTRRDYIFGLLPTNYNSSSELTAFLPNATLKEIIEEDLNK
jgi:hypothetical protein